MIVKLSLLAALRRAVSASVMLAATAIALSSVEPVSAKPAILQAQYADSLINVRSAPSTRASLVGTGLVGDSVELLREAPGPDGYTWKYVRFPKTQVMGWVRGDFVSGQRSRLSSATPVKSQSVAVSRQTLTKLPPTTPVTAVSSTSATPRSKNLALQSYTPEEIDYFLEVAMGGEFGDSTPKVRKWQGPVRVKVNGSPTAADVQTLQAVLQEIQGLTDGIQLQLVQDNPNLEIYFVPESDFRRYEPNYQPLNYGFFWTHWNNQDAIYNARILISTVGISQQERSHLIREELTQSLGLMRDSNRYQNSIFFQGWTAPVAYAEIDKAVIQLLYRREIRPGMTRSQVMQVLKQFETASQPSLTQLELDPTPLDFTLSQVPTLPR